MKNRDLSLDLVRVLACFLVVLMHSPIPSDNANGPFLAMLSYFTAPCIGLFFMVSGALLLPVKMDYFTFLKRRLSKVVIPTLVWTAIYLTLNIYFSRSEINILHAIASVPFAPQGNGVLWFMYTMIGLYLLSPILSAWVVIASDRELKFVLALWVITLCYPILVFGVDINSSTTGILYYFTGYAGYFLLGYALKSGRLIIPITWPILIAVSGVILLLVLKYSGIEYDFYSLFWYESIFIVGLCCFYWIMIKKTTDYLISGVCTSGLKMGGGTRLIVCTLSNISFGVYLMHILIMRYWLWKMDWIQNLHSYILQTIIVTTITMSITIAACMLLARTPLANVMIGYREK